MTGRNSDTSLTLGIDLGGTKLEVVLTDENGKVLTSHRSATKAKGVPDAVISDMVKGVNTCLEQSGKSALALGVGMAGQISRGTGYVHFSPNLDWYDVPLKDKLEESLDIPVTVTNDVRAAAYGEWQYGAARGYDDVVAIFVGTGIGGAIISNGRLLEGCNNSAGELGHITIMRDGRKCRCRNKGCYEAYAGGWAIAERAQEKAHAHPVAGQTLINLSGGVESISAVTVTDAYKKGDALAREIVEETAQYLAAGLTGIINALNPCLVIFGGGVIQGLPEYVTLTERIVQLDALETALAGLEIATATLGRHAGAIGAAALARHNLEITEV